MSAEGGGASGAAAGRFGRSDESLLTASTVFRDGLLAGQVILVSGAGSGIGKAIACLLGRLGARVVLCGRGREKLEQTAELLRRADAPPSWVWPVTIRDPDQVAALFADVYATCGRLDILINNAGGQFAQPALDISPKGWRAVIDTNLNGTWTMMQCAARHWREASAEGTILNIVAPYVRGMYGVAHTVAARAAVAYLSRNLAVEWAPHRIRVNCVLPGTIGTAAMDQYPPEAQDNMARGNPLFRIGDVQDIAEACVYLAAPSGRFITGEVLTVDGGQQLWGELWLAGKPDYFREGGAAPATGGRGGAGEGGDG